MKQKILFKIADTLLSKKFGMGFCIVAGAAIGGLLYKFGENTGEYNGAIKQNHEWVKLIEEIGQSVEEDKENNE